MHRRRLLPAPLGAALLSLATPAAVTLAMPAAAPAAPAAAGKTVPITSKSEEARKLYLEGRDLSEKLKAVEGHARAEAALAKDPEFAMGYVLLANTAQTNRDFFDAVKKAVALADKVSPGEKDLILGLDAGARAQPKEQRERYERLVAAFPDDPRAHMLLAAHHFGQQEFELAIGQYNAATKLDPMFTAPYNQLGYANRFLGRYPDAEKAFRRYIELIPDDPNPHDSYAELLMKMGRFEDSIAAYEKALAIDPHFAASLVGMANDQIFLGRGEAARATLARLLKQARNPGEERQAYFWTAVSWLHEDNLDQAIAAMYKEKEVADRIKDGGSAAQDLNVMGQMLLEAGKHDRAQTSFDESLAVLGKADLPADVKEAGKRQHEYLSALVALGRSDLPAAQAHTRTYGELVAAKGNPLEARQHHELLGRIALAGKDYATAVAELGKANDQDPRVLHHLGAALEGKGDLAAAREAYRKAAEWNALALNFAFVRKPAAARLASLRPAAKAGA